MGAGALAKAVVQVMWMVFSGMAGQIAGLVSERRNYVEEILKDIYYGSKLPKLGRSYKK